MSLTARGRILKARRRHHARAQPRAVRARNASTPASRSRRPSSPIRPPAPTAFEYLRRRRRGSTRTATIFRSAAISPSPRRVPLGVVRRHRRLELSAADRLLEGALRRSICRQCHGLQAVRKHAARRPEDRRDPVRGRACRRGSTTSSRATATTAARCSSITRTSPRSRSPVRSRPAARWRRLRPRA